MVGLVASSLLRKFRIMFVAGQSTAADQLFEDTDNQARKVGARPLIAKV